MGIPIAIAIFVLIAAALAFVATRPESFRIERSASIGASGEIVFPMINNFRRWELWSPWEKLDPSMKKSFDGPTAGRGAIYSWNGNKKVGEGRMTLLESKAGESVSIKLEFVRPFAGTNQVTFKLAPSDSGIRVTWSMDGKHNFVGKAFSVFMDMDAMVGKDFEEGLANLDLAARAETQRMKQAAKKALG